MMQEFNTQDTINVKGEIIEIYEESGKSFAKIQCCPGFIEVCIDELEELHLNDIVTLKVKLQINKIESNFDE